MIYEKLTPERFRIKLRERSYDGATGARRAIGKCRDWSEKDKKDAYALVDEHFEVPAQKTAVSAYRRAHTARAKTGNATKKMKGAAAPRSTSSAREPKSEVPVALLAKLLEANAMMRAPIDALRPFAAKDEGHRKLLDRTSESLWDSYTMVTTLLSDRTAP
jgi:hypothetical protein